MNRIIYGGITLAGLVFALLDFLIADRMSYAFSILVVTAFIISGIYLLIEFRFYRQHNALLASFQFLAIPTLLLLFGTVLAPLSFGPNWIDMHLALFNGLAISSTLTSLLLIAPIAILIVLYFKFFDGRYPGFVIRRRQLGPKKVPFLVHITSVTLILGLGYLTGVMVFLSLVFVAISIILWIAKLLVPALPDRQTGRSTSRRTAADRRRFLNSITGNSSGRGRRQRSYSSNTPSRSSERTDGGRRSSHGSRRRRRDIPTSPSSGYREVPVRSRNDTNQGSRSDHSRSSNRSSSRRNRPTPSRVARVDPGMEAISRTKTRKVKASKISDFFPKGNYDHSDLKCMVCYEDFSQRSKHNIIICPSCKFPAHEVELKSWLNTSERCPRCNKVIRGNKKLNSGIVSEAQYAKHIKKL